MTDRPAAARRLPAWNRLLRLALPPRRLPGVAWPDPGAGEAELLSQVARPGGPRGEAAVCRWDGGRPEDRRETPEEAALREGWVAWARGFRATALHNLTVDEVERATSWTTAEIGERHALGELRACDNIHAVANWRTPPWTFSALVLDLLERLGTVPTWPQFKDFLLRDEIRPRLAGPFEDAFVRRLGDPGDRQRHWDSFWWRVGLAYYSALREIDLLTRLRREHDIPVRYNVIADAVLKVDMWVDNVLVEVRIENPKYASAKEGRKQKSHEIMDVSGFVVLPVNLKAPSRYGRPSLVQRGDIADCARHIQDARRAA